MNVYHVLNTNAGNYNTVDCDAPVDYDYALRHWRAMSSEQKARANCLALQIQKGNPAFVHVLQQSCLTKSSRVVSSFSILHDFILKFARWLELVT